MKVSILVFLVRGFIMQEDSVVKSQTHKIFCGNGYPIITCEMVKIINN